MQPRKQSLAPQTPMTSRTLTPAQRKAQDSLAVSVENYKTLKRFDPRGAGTARARNLMLNNNKKSAELHRR